MVVTQFKWEWLGGSVCVFFDWLLLCFIYLNNCAMDVSLARIGSSHWFWKWVIQPVLQNRKSLWAHNNVYFLDRIAGPFLPLDVGGWASIFSLLLLGNYQEGNDGCIDWYWHWSSGYSSEGFDLIVYTIKFWWRVQFGGGCNLMEELIWWNFQWSS